MTNKRYIKSILVTLMMFLAASLYGQFVHPGIWHKKSDLDRMKAMVEARADPWYSSFNALRIDSKSSYNYVVQKDPSYHSLSRENPSDQRNQYESDSVAAYQLSLMWYITGDTRYADKVIEILNAWSELTNFYGGGTEPLSAGLYGAPLINAAEIIKNTYDGWSASDIQAFKDMLVYPGYSNTIVPQADIDGDNVTFYWRTYMGDPGRHGNQGLLAWRTVMAIGIFCDNEIIYDRAFNYLTGQPARSDDLPYTAGPVVIGDITEFCEYEESYVNSKLTDIPDYGYDDQIQHYIYDNGQCQEAFRDQNHSNLGISAILETAEMAWNQGDDIYSYLDNRILDGCEYLLRYNLSFEQGEPLEPTSFYDIHTRNGRWKGLKINPEIACGGGFSRGGNSIFAPRWELAVAHYDVRAGLGNEFSWTIRTRDYAISQQGFEKGDSTTCPGWGGLSFRRPEGCAGDPITGFDLNGLPEFNMNELGFTIEAENFDFFTSNGEDRVYNEMTVENEGGEYRTNEAVDIEVCEEGGYNVTSIEVGEYLTYTVNVPETGVYDISVRVAGLKIGGTISVFFGDEDVTGDVEVPSTGGGQSWTDLAIATNVNLTKGVYAMRILFGGADEAFNLNNISVGVVDKFDQTIDFSAFSIVEEGDEGIRIGAISSSGLEVSYSSSDTQIATITDGFLDFLAPGKVNIIASQMGNDIYNTAPQVAQVLQVNPAGSTHLIEAENYVNAGGIRLVSNLGENLGEALTYYTRTVGFMDYVVNIPAAGDYLVELQVSSGSTAGAIDMTVNGSSVYSVEYPAIGSLWRAVSTEIPVTFTEGENTIHLTSDDRLWQLDWLKIVLIEAIDSEPKKMYQKIDFPVIPNLVSEGELYDLGATASSGLKVSYSSSNTDIAIVSDGSIQVLSEGQVTITASQIGDDSYFPAPVVIQKFIALPPPSLFFEAEDYSNQLGVRTETTLDAGGGLNVGWIAEGDYMEYEVTIREAGLYRVDYRIASQLDGPGGGFAVSSNEILIESISFSSTGGWQVWETVSSSESFELTEGEHTIRITADQNNWNFNWFEFIPHDSLKTSNGTSYGWFDRHYSDLESDADYEEMDLSDTDGDGQLGWQEYLAGSDPTDPVSVFTIEGVVEVNSEDEGQLRVTWSSIQGRSYSVLYRSDLSSGEWNISKSSIEGQDVETSYVVPLAEGEKLYLRVAIENPSD